MRKRRGGLRSGERGLQARRTRKPLALETLREFGIPWSGHPPRSLDGLQREHWDYVITVRDRAKESCPIFPESRRWRTGASLIPRTPQRSGMPSSNSSRRD